MQTDTQTDDKPAVRSTDLLCDGVEAEILFEARHRQLMEFGDYEVTGNPITVRLGPAVQMPKNGTRSHSMERSHEPQKSHENE